MGKKKTAEKHAKNKKPAKKTDKKGPDNHTGHAADVLAGKTVKTANLTEPQEIVRQKIKAGKLKKKCCQSRPRCKRCPVLALKKERAALD